MNKTEELRKIMQENNMTQPLLAKFFGLSVSTISGWLAGENAKRKRNIPDSKLELLKLKLVDQNRDL